MELLSDEELESALPGLDWQRDGSSLVKVVERHDFAEAMVFVNAVAQLAEAANHHPDIDIRWNKVTLRLSTHSAGGLTRRDLDVAAAIDGLTGE